LQRRWSQVNPNKTRPFCQRYNKITKENEEAIKNSERAVIKMNKWCPLLLLAIYATEPLSFCRCDNIRNCKLLGLPDLYGASDYVRSTAASYLNHLVDSGVAGIRIDSARHMWPEDIMNIMSRVKSLPTAHGFASNSKLFVYSDVFDVNLSIVKVPEYYDIGLVIEVRYSIRLSWGIANYTQLKFLIDYGWGMSGEDRAYVFVDTPDTQRYYTADALSFKKPCEYTQGVSYMLAHSYGFPQVMSSYFFAENEQ